MARQVLELNEVPSAPHRWPASRGALAQVASRSKES